MFGHYFFLGFSVSGKETDGIFERAGKLLLDWTLAESVRRLVTPFDARLGVHVRRVTTGITITGEVVDLHVVLPCRAFVVFLLICHGSPILRGWKKKIIHLPAFGKSELRSLLGTGLRTTKGPIQSPFGSIVNFV